MDHVLGACQYGAPWFWVIIFLFLCGYQRLVVISFRSCLCWRPGKKEGGDRQIFISWGLGFSLTEERPVLIFVVYLLFVWRFPWVFLGLIMRGHQHAGSEKTKGGKGAECCLPFLTLFVVLL